MPDLSGALLAAAAEADKIQQEAEEQKAQIRCLEDILVDQRNKIDIQQNEIDDLHSHIDYVEAENHKLKTKLKCIAEHMISVANILLEE